MRYEKRAILESNTLLFKLLKVRDSKVGRRNYSCALCIRNEKSGRFYMSLINVSELTFYYDGSYDNIFEDVSFQIDTDWKLGFIGRNGKGKTTFLNLLLGKYEYKGTISSSVDFDYFPFQVKERKKNTIDIVEELCPEYEFWKICRELSLLNVDVDVLYRPFETLSNGEQTKVMLAVLFSKENNFLLIDEPTNHLDMETRILVKEYLNKKKGFILVSHDRSFLDGCIDHVLSINKCNIEVMQGNFSTWWENKQRQDAYELSENERLKKDIKRLEKAAKQSKEWADNVESTKIGKGAQKLRDKGYVCIDTRAYIGEKSKRMQQRRKNLENRQERAIEEKSGLLKNIDAAENLKIISLRHYKQTLVFVEDLALYYDDKCICKDINFTINNGDRVVLSGRNGCGKSSIIKKILGNEIQYEGKIETAAGLKISYVNQDTSLLKGSLKDYILENDLDESLFKALLRKLDFSRLQFEKKMEDYSGGQKKKVLIAKSLCEQAHLYIWDEPLNFIDVFSRMQIENLIKEFKPTMLLVEHDKLFMDNIATKYIKM